MNGKPAARVGDLTVHDDAPLVPGIGSLNVFTGGKPAWRTVLDIMQCPFPRDATWTPHGPEACYLGSKSVLINGQMATREEDILVTTGSVPGIGTMGPNPIVQGEPTVLIGDIPTGLATAEHIEEFCKEFCALVDKWESMSIAEREQGMTDLVNKHLSSIGVPDLPVTLDSTLDKRIYGGFSSFSWDVVINPIHAPDVMTGEQIGELGNTLFHEARHAEQAYASVQFAAGQNPGLSASRLRGTCFGSNQRIAEAAVKNPLTSGDDGFAFGEAMHRTFYGDRSLYSTNVMDDSSKFEEQYRALPEEVDAWAVGDSTGNCGGCKG